MIRLLTNASSTTTLKSGSLPKLAIILWRNLTLGCWILSNHSGKLCLETRHFCHSSGRCIQTIRTWLLQPMAIQELICLCPDKYLGKMQRIGSASLSLVEKAWACSSVATSLRRWVLQVLKRSSGPLRTTSARWAVRNLVNPFIKQRSNYPWLKEELSRQAHGLLEDSLLVSSLEKEELASISKTPTPSCFTLSEAQLPTSSNTRQMPTNWHWERRYTERQEPHEPIFITSMAERLNTISMPTWDLSKMAGNNGQRTKEQSSNCKWTLFRPIHLATTHARATWEAKPLEMYMACRASKPLFSYRITKLEINGLTALVRPTLARLRGTIHPAKVTGSQLTDVEDRKSVV